jgi:hypothetical protein
MSASTLKPPKQRNTLGSLATAITCLFWLVVVATCFRLILALFGQGPWLGAHIGGPSTLPAGVCLNAAPALLPHNSTALTQPGLAPGVHATWTAASVCASHPAFRQNLAFTLTLLPIDLLRVGALYLVQQLARTVAREGVYTDRVARLLWTLGWWLLAGGLVATTAEGFARLNLLGQLVTGPVDWGQWGVAWSVSWPVAWIGLGLIIFARVMRIGAGMRADLEGTV